MAAPRRRLAGGFLLVIVSLIGAALFRRRRVGRGEHVDLYYTDGTLVSLAAGADADALLEVAREVVREARA